MKMAVTIPDYENIRNTLLPKGLDILGGFSAEAPDTLPNKAKTLLLIGPSEAFWDVITGSLEMVDNEPDPIDRWSRRVISSVANQFGGTAVFPFDGPPYFPFYSWALKTGRVWASPVKLAVHDTFGLFVSFRGAILLPSEINIPPLTSPSPCVDCSKPCLTACPVGALNEEAYNVQACHDFLNQPQGDACMSTGCAVRRSCPVGRDSRSTEPAAYHMHQFHKTL